MTAHASSRIELSLTSKKQHSVGKTALRLDRLVILIRIMPTRPAVEAYVDTGAFLSIFPEQTWDVFRHQITWPDPADEAALPGWCRSFGGVAGMTAGGIQCRLGSVAIQLVSASRPLTICDPFTIWALFALDGGMIEKPLFGLGGGTLANHLLAVDYTHATAALIPNAPIP